MTDSAAQEPVVRSRRAVLAAAAGGAAALAASALGPASVAAIAAPMLTETNNAASAPTGVTNSNSGDSALFGHATGAGVGVEGESDSGPAIIGQSKDTSDPANDMRNTGVIGVAGNQISDIAANTSLTGVYGYSDPSSVQGFAGAGVWGDSPDFGVYGTGNVGVFGVGPVGAIGETDVSGGIGVAAISDVASALALRVIGRAEFTRSGKATIAAGKASKSISLAGCTTSTIVFALLASSRGGRWVRAVVPTTGSFTVYLNTTVASNTAVAWIAFTNPTNHSG